jgi:hypothetical protein
MFRVKGLGCRGYGLGWRVEVEGGGWRVEGVDINI